DGKRPGSRALLLQVLERQHVEISRTTAPVTVAVTIPNGPSENQKPNATTSRTFAAGSYVIRMDHPFSRIADVLLDRQYWSLEDPQKHPYDDTSWSMGDLFDVDVARVNDQAILKTPMETLTQGVEVPQGLAAIDMHASAKLPRIAIMHTWISTQTEGWWRMALDQLKVPFTYISTQDLAREPNLRSKYDVILFGPVGRASTQQIIDGMPMWGNPMPWKTTKLTPNIGRIDSTDDIRPGMGETGLANLKRFVHDGGLLITSEDTAKFAIDTGMAPGVFITPTSKLRVVGSVLQAKFA